MTPEDAREFPSPEEAARRLAEESHDPILALATRRLADAYTVVVEVAERLASGWYPTDDLRFWCLAWSPEVAELTPAHAAFLRSIRETGGNSVDS